MISFLIQFPIHCFHLFFGGGGEGQPKLTLIFACMITSYLRFELVYVLYYVFLHENITLFCNNAFCFLFKLVYFVLVYSRRINKIFLFAFLGGRILGKSNCENMCMDGTSFTGAAGPVLNPHDPTRSAGGSSSGSAVLVGKQPLL